MSRDNDFWSFADNFLQNQDNSKLTQDVNCEELDDNRIELLNSRFKWTPSLIQQTINKFKKSSSRSMKYAEEAIEAANDHEDSHALKLANMITAYAVDDGDLALGHWIRFKLLCSLKPDDFRIILSELQSALRSPIPPKNTKIELKRQSKIEGISYTFNKQKLGQIVQEISEVVYQLYTSDKSYKNKMESMKKFTKDVFRLKSPNQKAPALEDFVEIKYHSSRGRHLIVTKDIPVGTTLLVEKPFVSGLTNMLELEINRCHHCYKADFTPIPCPNCVFVLFCSKKCKSAAQIYHQFECKCFPDLFFLESMCHPKNWLIAFKLISNLGSRQLYQHFQREQSISSLNENSTASSLRSSTTLSNGCEIKGIDPVTGIFDPCSLHTVRHIFKAAKNCNHTPFKPLVSIALCRILETRTDFFQKLKLDLDKMTKFQNWISKIILETAASYTTKFYDNNNDDYETFKKYDDGKQYNSDSVKFQCNDFGGAKFATTSLISHSCNPNLIQVEYPNTKGNGIALIARRDLKSGEELCKSYCLDFPFLDKVQRQEKLMESGNDFSCDCVVCLEDWPILEQLESVQRDRPTFCCRRCAKNMKIEERRRENFKEIALISSNETLNGLKCPECSSLYSERDLKSQLKRHSEILDGNKLVQKGKISEMIKSLKIASKFFHENLIPPSYLQIKCDDLLQQTIALSIVDGPV